MEFADFIKTPNTKGVILHRPFLPPLEGTLCISSHYFILSSSDKNNDEIWVRNYLLSLSCLIVRFI